MASQQFSNPLVDLEGQTGFTDGKYEKRVRNGFIRKVLAITSTQLLLTSAVTASAMFNERTRFFILQPAVMIGSLIALIAASMALFCGQSKKYPLNYFLLLIFTLAESVTVSVMCLAASERTGSPFVVLKALGVTTIVVCGLTTWAMQSKRDFGHYIGLFVIAGFSLVGVSVLNMFLRSSLLQSVICGMTAVVFGYYLMYDIQRLFKSEVDLDDYILMSLNLYMDIIVVFQNILMLVSKADD
eukprot:GHVH01016458.1.p1 GENE.GHVH01016458.1~~GHVH01016458.1.p1  ORF type:complete len:242 (-),score=31.82 GHVH01016458.1:79-804(-)